jgi:diguanylate cyclase (GGDEF)-like protein
VCYDALGQIERLVGVTQDITARRRNEELAQHLAFVDLATGLPNRNSLIERLHQAMRVDGGERTLALLLLDLQQFREINNTLGHRQGDIVLKEIGRRLRAAAPERDFVGRIGGDEFAVVVDNPAGIVELSAIVQRLQNALHAPISIERVPIAVEAAFGVALFRYVRRLPVDRLKIDRSFVSSMTQSSSDTMIVRSTIDLAHNLGLEVVAEGVETQGQYSRLADWGCDFAQGYFISRPLPADQLWLRLAQWKLEA